MPLLDQPSPVRLCSFRMTYPTPGRSRRVLGAGSATSAPFTTRFDRVEPSASLLAPVASRLLLATATTPSVEMSPFSRLTAPSVALLTALEPYSGSASPLTIANASCAVTRPATSMLWP